MVDKVKSKYDGNSLWNNNAGDKNNIIAIIEQIM
jgi:hypothetical protein